MVPGEIIIKTRLGEGQCRTWDHMASILGGHALYLYDDLRAL